MNATQHAVVEVSAKEITLRVGSRWIRFLPYSMQYSNGLPLEFLLQEDGTVRLQQGPQEEMDIAAERIAREMMAQAT